MWAFDDKRFFHASSILGVGGTGTYLQKLLAPLFLVAILGLKEGSKGFFWKYPFLEVCPSNKTNSALPSHFFSIFNLTPFPPYQCWENCWRCLPMPFLWNSWFFFEKNNIPQHWIGGEGEGQSLRGGKWEIFGPQWPSQVYWWANRQKWKFSNKMFWTVF